MPGTCLNSWQTSEWSIGDVWRSSNWIERGIFIALLFMLAYAVFVLSRFCRRYYAARRESRALAPDSRRACLRSQRNLVADLSRELRTLKAIAFAAPFLGLAGTSYWILDALFYGVVSGSRAWAEAVISSRIAAALVFAAAGILVAIPAILSHSLLLARIDRFEGELSGTLAAGPTLHQDQAIAPFRRAQTLPLQGRFSGLPTFALLAAPALASVIAIFTVFHPYEVPTGLEVGVASARCQYDDDDRVIVLRITDAGELFINSTPEDWNSLQVRLSEIYRLRVHRTLYLHADDGVPFQIVADAIDIARNAPLTLAPTAVSGTDESNITVRLITPIAMNARCVDPVVIRSRTHALR